MGGEIALLALGAIFGIATGSYALGQVGKSCAIPVNLAWMCLFGIGAMIGGFCGILAIMASV